MVGPPEVVGGHPAGPGQPLGIPPKGIPATDPKYRDLAAHGKLPRDVFNVLSFGASGDGNIDDTKAIQRAVDAANKKGGGTVYLPRGRYRITDEIRLYAGVHVRGEGHESVIDWKGTDTVQGNGRRKCSFLAYGSVGTYKNLTVTATDGATSLSVAAGDEAIVSAGDYIRVTSSEKWDPADQNANVGEIAQVASTASGVINLTDPLFDGYATGDTARVAKLTLIEDITLSDFRIVGDFQGAENDQAGITFNLCKNVNVYNVRSEDVGNYHFQFLACVDVNFIGNSTHRAETAPQGYGITLGGCQFVNIAGNNFYGGSHAVSHGSALVYTAGATTALGSINRVHTISGNTVWDVIGTGIGSHAAAEFITVTGNVIKGGGSTGISSRGPNWTVVGNIIHRAPGGIGLSNYTASRRCTHIIANNQIEYPTSFGIAALPITGASENNVGWVIQGNTVMQESTGTAAIQVGADASYLVGVSICGNTVRQAGEAAVGIRGDKLTAPAITGNSVCQDGTQTNPQYRLENVVQFTFAGNTGRAGSDAVEVLDCNNCDEGAITGNAFTNGTHSINLDANCSNIALVGNNFFSWSVAYISNAGAGMKVAHNIGSDVHVL